MNTEISNKIYKFLIDKGFKKSFDNCFTRTATINSKAIDKDLKSLDFLKTTFFIRKKYIFFYEIYDIKLIDCVNHIEFKADNFILNLNNFDNTMFNFYQQLKKYGKQKQV